MWQFSTALFPGRFIFLISSPGLERKLREVPLYYTELLMTRDDGGSSLGSSEIESELELIEQAKNGNQQAFGKLALRYRKNVFGLAYRMTGHPEEAEDLTQDVFLRAYLSLHRFTPNRDGAFKSWLLTITSRLCIDRARHKRSHPGESLEDYEQELPTGEKSVLETVTEEETREQVRMALRLLPENYRMAMILKYQEDLDYQAIARIMKIPLGTDATLLNRGRAQLKKILLERGIIDEKELVAR